MVTEFAVPFNVLQAATFGKEKGCFEFTYFAFFLRLYTHNFEVFGMRTEQVNFE